MAKYCRVSPYLFWGPTSQFPDLSLTAQLVYCYVTNNRHRNSEGLFVLPKPFVAHEMRQPLAEVEEALTELEKAGYITYDESTEVILDRRAMQEYKPNTNQMTGALNKIEELPPTKLKAEFLRLVYVSSGEGDDFYERLVEKFPNLVKEAFPNSSESLSKDFSKARARERARARQLEEELEKEPETEKLSGTDPSEDFSVARILKAQLKQARDNGDKDGEERAASQLRELRVSI